LARIHKVNSPRDRVNPATLEEQVALMAAKAQGGTGALAMEARQMNDSRWVGWVKVRYTHTLPNGKNITVHCWHNPFTGENVGF
jgi:hypothetical protein